MVPFFCASLSALLQWMVQLSQHQNNQFLLLEYLLLDQLLQTPTIRGTVLAKAFSLMPKNFSATFLQIRQKQTKPL